MQSIMAVIKLEFDMKINKSNTAKMVQAWISGSSEFDNIVASNRAYVFALVGDTDASIDTYGHAVVKFSTSNSIELTLPEDEAKKALNKKLSQMRQYMGEAAEQLELQQKPTFKRVNPKKPELGYEVTWIDFPIPDTTGDEVQAAWSALYKLPNDAKLKLEFDRAFSTYQDAIASINRAQVITDEAESEADSLTREALQLAEVEAAREVDTATAAELEGMSTKEIRQAATAGLKL